jgi:hypothetical protein
MNKDDALKLYIEENKMMWSRTQTVASVEVAVLAGWYIVVRGPDPVLAGWLLLAGNVVLVALLTLMRLDADFIDHYGRIAEISRPTDRFLCLKGRYTGYFVSIFLMVCNALLAWR